MKILVARYWIVIIVSGSNSQRQTFLLKRLHNRVIKWCSVSYIIVGVGLLSSLYSPFIERCIINQAVKIYEFPDLRAYHRYWKPHSTRLLSTHVLNHWKKTFRFSFQNGSDNGLSHGRHQAIIPNILSLTLRNKHHWNLHRRNSCIFMQENA